MHRLLPLAFTSLTLLATGCASGDSEPAGLVRSDPVGHVHAMGVDPADGAVMLATHGGLFRAAPGDAAAVRLGDERRDVMGFTVEGPRSYVGSGHPDPRSGGPGSVGFIRSQDGGRTWANVSLEGTADLHALKTVAASIVAYDALSGRLLVSGDRGRTWSRAAVPPALDVAIDPDDPERVFVSSVAGLLASDDGGRSFRPAADLAPSLLTWRDGALTAVDETRTVLRIDPSTLRAAVVGRAPVTPSALTTDARGTLYVADDTGVVHTSSDGGRTWSPRLGPAREGA